MAERCKVILKCVFFGESSSGGCDEESCRRVEVEEIARVRLDTECLTQVLAVSKEWSAIVAEYL